MSLDIKLEKGNYGKEDKIILVEGKKITLEEICEILILIRDNENKRQGEGWKNIHGDYLFLTMLHKINQGISLEELKPFLIRGQRRVDFEKVGFNYKQWKEIFCEVCGSRAFCKKCKKYIWRKKNGKP